MKKKILLCAAVLSLMMAGAAYAKDEHPNKQTEKKTGLENALERGKKNDNAREAIRRAMERKHGHKGGEWTAEKRVAAAVKELKITLDSQDQVTQAMALPLIGAHASGSTITWVSSQPSVISNDGQTVNRPTAGQGDAAVTLTATITYGGISDTKTFSLTVKQLFTDAQRVASDKAALAITFSGADMASSVTQPLILAPAGPNGSSITWVSSNTSIISNDGKSVQRPSIGSGDTSVVMSAILTYGNSSEVKTFTLTVIHYLTDAQRVAADNAVLAVSYWALDSGDHVTHNVILPAEGPNGSNIIWFTSKTAVISNSGAVTRPAAGSGDVGVVLTAVIRSGVLAETKAFILTVKQLP